MFSSTFSILLVLQLLALFSRSESTRLCRDCMNGEITFNITDKKHGNFFSKVTGSCVTVHHAEAKGGARFDDLGSGRFNFTSADNNWSFHCNLTPDAIGCCDIS